MLFTVSQSYHHTENVPARIYTETIRLLSRWPPDIFLSDDMTDLPSNHPLAHPIHHLL